MFAVGETLFVATSRQRATEIRQERGGNAMTKEDWKRSRGAWLRGTLIGFPLGALPAGGPDISIFLSYSL
jgi:putative tricarboxylic transport membrane protein